MQYTLAIFVVLEVNTLVSYIRIGIEIHWDSTLDMWSVRLFAYLMAIPKAYKGRKLVLGHLFIDRIDSKLISKDIRGEEPISMSS